MLGRRSTLIGAMVQATNIAIHNTIERKPAHNKAVYAKRKQMRGNHNQKEVVHPTEEIHELETSNVIE
jgi:hypothetical protein